MERLTVAVERLAGIPALLERVGGVLGVSEWLAVEQTRIDAFADATGDHQWIHTDPERAARESPYGTTIAHGYLTLSLLPLLASQAFAVDGVGTRINYGLNRVRFTAPVPAGARVRASFRLKAVEPQAEHRFLITVEATVEAEGAPRPACIAEMLAIYAQC
ncbi:MAG TPA: MaoC family dehydratase [Azospirillum sp.]|nr:MaoC family dehydratase [Azospirillum sp.]